MHPVESRLARAAIALALLVACSPSPSKELPPSPDAGNCANPCDCCAAGEVCYEQQCCQPSCEGKACGSDGCGGTCSGSCEPNQTCNPETGRCECQETAQQLCGRLQAACGPLTATDACGVARSVDCGSCAPGQQCDVQAHACIACPETDTEFCQRLHKTCGQVTAEDACGGRRTDVDCGRCEPGFQCGVDNTCESCTSESKEDFCLRQNATCGSVTALDNCRRERTEDCGSCTAPASCDAQSHQCKACEPESETELCQAAQRDCAQFATVDRCNVARTVSCGVCGFASERCNEQTGQCELCVGESPSELCDDYGKSCGAPTLTDSCGVPVPVTSCGSCTGNETCQANDVCGIAGVPTNDTCAHPEMLRFDTQGLATVNASMLDATDTVQGSCGGYGKDLVYAFRLTNPRNVAITMTGSNGLIPYLHLNRICDDKSTEVGPCVSGTQANPVASFAVHALAAGTYYLWADSSASTSGDFTLTVATSTPPPAPSNDTCANPKPLNLVAGVAHETGDLTEASDDYRASCLSSTFNGPDLVYSFTLAADAVVTAKVTRDAGATTFFPAVSIATACPVANAADQLACGLQTSGVASATATFLPAGGTYFVIVDSTWASYGAFTLDVTAAPTVPGDVCLRARPIALVPSGADLVGTETGDTSFAFDDYAGSCKTTATGPDLVYAFAVPAGGPKDAVVLVTPTGATGANLRPTVYLRSDCAPGASEKGCLSAAAAGGPITLGAFGLDPGTYYLFVDGYSAAAAGAFTLELALRDPPAAPTNDLCAGAIELTPDATTGAITVNGATVSAGDDYLGSCATGSVVHSGGDVTYKVHLDARSSLSATVSPDGASGTFRPAVYIETRCGDASSSQACRNGNAGATTRASAASLPAGDYFVVVDGQGGTSGFFSLTVVVLPSVPNDSCATVADLAVDLNGDFTARGDSCALADDATNDWEFGSCYAGHGAGAPDLVYRLVTDRVKNVELSFTPGHTGYSMIYLRGTCGDANSEQKCHEAAGGAVNTLTLKKLPAGTYYIWLDNDAGTCGSFEFHARVLDPPAPPANDACAGAEALDFVNDVATASGDTDVATGGSAGSCRSSASGGDLAYFFTLDEPKTVEITATPRAGSALAPVLYLRGACDLSTSELGCDARYAAGTAARLSYARLQQGTYYVIVDSFNGTATGAFDLRVVVGTPGPTESNDRCVRASVLPAFDATGSASATGNTLNASDDDSASCANTSNPFNGPDLVYKFNLPQAANVTATVTRDASNTVYRPAVSLRRACEATSELACSRESSGVATLTVTLDAGDYYVVVDGIANSYGPFTLEVKQNASAPVVAGDSCGNPIPLTFNGSRASINGDLGAADVSNDLASSCATTTGSDLVYSFELADEKLVTITLAPNGGTTLKPVLSLRRYCGSLGSESACAYNSSPNTTATLAPQVRLLAGTYYVLVDSSGATGGTGPFTLSVDLADPANPLAGNDTCGQALALTLDPATNAVQVQGDTRDGLDDYLYGGSCGGTNVALSGGDLVYSVHLGQTATLSAAVSRDGSTPSYWPAVYIRNANCESTAPADQVACYTNSSYATVGVTAPNLAPGTYYVVVDGQKGTVGKFTLDVVARTAAVANKNCASALPLAFDPSGLAEATGDTALGASGMTGSCTSGGSELVYSFTTSATKDVKVDVLPLGLGLAPAVYIRSDCAVSGTQLACAFSSSSTALTASAYKLVAGTYYVIVDSYSASSLGAFVLRIKQSDPPPPPAWDTCAGATPLNLPASGAPALRVSDVTASGLNDYASTCGTSSLPLNGPDLVYSFTVPSGAPTKVTAKVTPKSSTYRPAVYIRRTCEAVANDACKAASNVGQVATLTVSLSAGTWYLVVDGVSGTMGEFDLDLSQDTTKYVDGDTCTNAVPLDGLFQPATGGVGMIASFQGNPSSGTDDTTIGCWADSYGKDVVYTFQVRQPSYAEIAVSRDGATSKFAPAFALRRSCADRWSELPGGCTASSTGTSRSLRVHDLTPGTYFLWVDPYNSGDGTSAEGAFTGTVTLVPTPAAPQNDSCLRAETLALPASTVAGTPVPGSTSFATNDLTGDCATSAAPFDGPEVVYSLTVAADTQINATVTPTGISTTNYRPAFYIRPACTTGGNDLCKAATSVGSAATLKTSLKAGTYYLVVDGVLGTRGDFEILLTQDTSKYQAGDNCSNATSLDAQFAPDATGTLVAPFSGDTYSTSNATDNGAGSCGTGTYADLVFRFSTAEEVAASIAVTAVAPQATLKPSIYLRRACADVSDAAQLGCAQATTSPNGTATLRVPRLPPGTYHLWVDGNGTTGTFTGTVGLSVPQTAPANATCGSAEPLVFNGSTAQVPLADTTNGAIDSVASCAGKPSTGPELFYSFSLTQAAKVVAKVERAGTTATQLSSPTVYVRPAGRCTSDLATDQIVCANYSTSTSSATATKLNLPAGDYVVVVDAPLAGYGTFKLTVTTDLPSSIPDDCQDAAVITPAPGTQFFSGDMTSATNSGTNARTLTGSGKDVVYTFVLTAPTTFSASMTYTATNKAILYLRRVCMASSAADELLLDDPDGAIAAIGPAALPAGQYWLWLDGTSASTGTYTLAVTFQ